MTSGAALEGVLVTELGGREAVAVCGSLLAQLGATVVVVEPDSPTRPRDRHRRHFVAGKKSVFGGSKPLASTSGVRRLVARSDIVLTSSDMDADQWRLDVAAPDNVICDITAFGSSGPLAGMPYSDLQVQALSGIMDTTGEADGPPVPIGVPIVSYLTGTYAASAVLAAHRARRLQGIGQTVEVALFDVAFVTMNAFLSSILTDKAAEKTRMGNLHPTVSPWNLFRSADGWVLICAGSQAQWQRLCELMGRANLAERFATQASRITGLAEINASIETWTRTLSTDECVEKLVGVGVAAGPIATIDLHPREANLDFRSMFRRLRDPVAEREVFVSASPLKLHGSPACDPTSIPAPGTDQDVVTEISAAPPQTGVRRDKGLDRPLAGVRVIEIGQYTTAPLCARHLAHLGAEVIKIEQPGGDASRTWVPHVGSRSVSFRLNNADKRSLVLDLRQATGVEALSALLCSADVLVENTKPGTLSKFGLSPTRIQQVNPRLIHCAISGFGAESLYASRPAFDSVIQAMSGFMAALRPVGVPLKSGISTADTMGAEMAMTAILGALEYRDRSGRGQYIDLSMQDISCWLTETVWNKDLAAITRPPVMACADGYVLVEAAEDLPGDLKDRIAALRRAEAASILEREGYAAAPVLSIREAAELPQTLDRRLWFTMEEDGLSWPMLASPLRLHRTPPRVTHLAPDTNQDGDAILGELGLLAGEGQGLGA